MFIVLEGPDGVGKTTQCRLLAERLERELPANVVSLREPTGGEWGQLIRQAARDHKRPTPAVETEWFIADRRQDVELNIKPALARGWYVVLDRYYFSTAAYQGARDVSIPDIIRRSREFCVAPDLCFVLLGDQEAALKRIMVNRGDTPDAFEAIDYQKKVADNFRRLIKEDKSLIEINADRTIEEVHGEIWKYVESAIK